MRPSLVVVLAAATLASAATLAQNRVPVPEGPVEGEYWQVSQQMSMEGMPFQMPVQTHKICKPKNVADQDLGAPDDKNCRMTSQRQVGNKFVYEVECTGKDKYTGKGEFERLGPDAYRGRMTMTMAEGTATMNMEGRKVGGACDPYADVRRMNASMAKGEADSCRRLGGELSDPAPNPQLGGYDPGCQTRNKKAFCEGAKAAAPRLLERSTYRSIGGTPGWRKAYALCGLDAGAVLVKNCASAVAERDFGFVAEFCPADGERIAAAQCGGRDLTAWRSAGVLELCEKFSASAREVIRADRVRRGLPPEPPASGSEAGGSAGATGSATGTATGAEQAEPPPAEKPGAMNKLKKGAKGLKDLFKVPGT